MAHYQTPFGLIDITLNNEMVTQIHFSPRAPSTSMLPSSISQAFDQYFSGKSNSINVPTQLIGTDFQKTVWQALQTIPRGHTWSYGQLAKKLGSHPRAIGQACRRNPIPLIYPCHRIVSASDLGGFSGQRDGDMLVIKAWLLEFEKTLKLKS